MKTIEELKKEQEQYLPKTWDYYEVLDLIDQAVEIERQRIIGVIDEEMKKAHNPKDNIDMVIYNTLFYLKNISLSVPESTPQPESVPDTMLASEDTLKKDWGNPAEDEAWKDLMPDPNDKLKVKGTQNSTPQQEYCEWEWRDDFHCFLTTCEVEFRDNYYDKFPIKMDYWKYCPRCSKPIKIKED